MSICLVALNYLAITNREKRGTRHSFHMPVDLFFKQKYMLIYNRYMKRCLRFFVKKNSLCALIACYPLHIRKHFNVSFLKKAVLKVQVQTPPYKVCAFVSNYQLYILLDAY